MKLLYKIFALFCISGIFAACADLDIKNLSDKSEFKAAVMTAPSSINIAPADLAEGSEATVKFEWTAADFGLDVAVSYTIYAKYGTESAELFIGLVGVTEHEVKAAELYGKLSALGIADGVAANVTFTIAATIGSNFDVVTSAEKSVSVTIDSE